MSPPPGQDPADDRPPPLLRVVRGAPTDVELAAVVTVLTAVTTAAAADEPVTEPTVTSRWNDRGRSLRRSLTVGPAAWRTAFWPG